MIVVQFCAPGGAIYENLSFQPRYHTTLPSPTAAQKRKDKKIVAPSKPLAIGLENLRQIEPFQQNPMF